MTTPTPARNPVQAWLVAHEPSWLPNKRKAVIGALSTALTTAAVAFAVKHGVHIATWQAEIAGGAIGAAVGGVITWAVPNRRPDDPEPEIPAFLQTRLQAAVDEMTERVRAAGATITPEAVAIAKAKLIGEAATPAPVDPNTPAT